MIQIKKYSELREEIKGEVNEIINSEFGHIPIVSDTEWACPDWTIIYYENKEIATFYNIVERNIIVDGEKVKIAGINNVITPKKFRGKGYASKLLRETEYILFKKLDCKMGILLCADNMIPFYALLNWYKVDSDIYFEQSSGQKIWSANVMLLTKDKKINPNKIDLNGLPW